MERLTDEIILNKLKLYPPPDDDYTEGFFNGFMSGLEDAREFYESQLRWIPVTERLPDIGVKVEIYQEDCETSFASREYVYRDQTDKWMWCHKCAMGGYELEWEYDFKTPEYWRPCAPLPGEF